jgi:hypothetical protein
MAFKEFVEYTFYFFVGAILHIIDFILWSGMNAQSKDIAASNS